MNFREDYYVAKWWEKPPKEKIDKTIKEKTTQSVIKTLEVDKKEQKNNTSFQWYFWYKIDLHEWRITSIRFIFNEKKYKVSFDYSISVINPHNSSWCTQQEEVKRVDFIGNIQLQAKVKSWYWEYKSPRNNKFRDVWITLKSLTKFIKQVLFEYKNN